MRRLLLATIVSFAASPVLADTVIEYGCDVAAKGPTGKIERILPETKVLEATQSLPAFSITLPQGYSEASIECSGSDLVPAENDWKVLRAGYPLIITEKPTGITIVVELDNGRFQLRFSQASMPAEEQLKRLQARADQLQTSLQDADFPPAGQK